MRTDPASRPTVRAARWSATHPWRAVALWLVFVAACIAVGNAAGLRNLTEVEAGVGQSGQATRWIHDAELEGLDQENVLITARHGALPPSEVRRAAAAVRSRMSALPAVAHVSAPAASKDGSAVTIEVTLAKDAEADTLLAATKSVQRGFPTLRVEEVGSVSLNDAVNTQVADDLSAAATFSLPVTLVILLIAFGAIVAAGVPLLLALSAVGAATGLSSLTSHLLPDSGSTSSM